MTSVPTGRDEEPGRREERRRELAAAVDRDPAELPDQAHLTDDLALDSLDMLSMLTWMQTHGVTNADGRNLRRVGQVLDLVGRAGDRAGLSVVVTAAPPGTGWIAAATTPPRPDRRQDKLVPVLNDAAYLLSPIQEEDLPFLYTLATHPEVSYRWRYRGNPPPPERFAADLWGNVLVQLIARTAADSRPAGLVVAYDADLAHGHALLGAVFAPEHAGTGLPAGASALFARYLFHTFPLRKLYLEIPGFNWDQVRSGAGRLFTVEGVLRAHDFYAGRYWDKRLCAIYRPGGEPRPDPAE
ncbi:GNAT family protein [Actinoplanes sp. NPDC049118]|uniref:GNAT family N-acetyltransferase n=1 Tax=Actinoplanes sp. NPDC049118 TaxID=3155769 RepID=UPI00340C2729